VRRRRVDGWPESILASTNSLIRTCVESPYATRFSVGLSSHRVRCRSLVLPLIANAMLSLLAKWHPCFECRSVDTNAPLDLVVVLTCALCS